MGLLQNVLKGIRERRTEQKTENQIEIDNYIQSEKQKHRIDAIMKHEHDSFLYGKGES